MEEKEDIQLEDSNWRFEVLEITQYKGCKVYIRRIKGSENKGENTYGDCFEYLLIYNGEIYTSHIAIVPESSEKEDVFVKITDEMAHNAVSTVLAAAMTTIDRLLGDTEPVSEDVARAVEALTGEQVKSKED